MDLEHLLGQAAGMRAAAARCRDPEAFSLLLELASAYEADAATVARERSEMNRRGTGAGATRR